MTLAEQVGALRRTLHLKMTRRLTARSKRSLQELVALRAVTRGEVRRQAELAARLLIDAPAASRLVDRLERDGLLRRQSGSDRRSVNLQVTAAGKRQVEPLEVEIKWLNAELARHLAPAEIQTLTRLLAKLQAGLDSAK
jgi:DNA-binding MarR family transcriptional regulator